MEPVKLDYDAGLSRVCTWRLLPDQDGIEARVRVASGPEVGLEIELRWRREIAQAPQAIHVRPRDSALEIWTTESARLHTDLPRLSLELAGCPSHVAEALRLL